ncbi:MAG TPA: heterodisulfide reductase-related iron-sulfur binding cluster [Acidimicrobiia bacterium]|nr:heterodisulfide reductase-related iron-sulfur binding cluster [Acidimicrobiia bacterium]
MVRTVNPKVEPERIHEFEHVTVRDVDLSGHWNRMFDPRVITDYDVSQLDRVTGLPGGESMGWCYQCAQCIAVCPVDHVGSYGPRKIYRNLQLGMDLFTSPDLWLCTTCGNCLRVCPKEVNFLDIMPAVRQEAVLAGYVPKELQDVFEKTARYGNPLGQNPKRRHAWTKGLDVEVPLISELGRKVQVLWWVSDYPSYHPRGMNASRSLARVLHRLGVDFAILGPDEYHDGDSMLRAGEPGLFEMLADHNIEVLNRYDFDLLVTTDPHAYNAFLHEYPARGGAYDVVHYSRFLADRIAQLGLSEQVARKVTFHDPCYLGRHNGEYQAPRDLINALPGVEFVEMWRVKENGYCCGGGGGGMWLDGHAAGHQRMRLSEKRVLEAIETGADTLCVVCPYEVSRFEDAVKSTNNDGRLDVRDIAELLAEALGLPTD